MAPKVICPKCGSTERTSNGRDGSVCAPCRRERRRRGPVAVKSTDAPLSIAEFLLNKKRAVCPVCRLREPVASLVTKARKDGERQADIIEYLKAVHRVTVEPSDFARHISQRHVA